MSKKQTRRSISVRGTTYDALRVYCEKQGVSMSEVVEERVATLLGLGASAPRAVTPAPAPAPIAVVRPRAELTHRGGGSAGRPGRKLSVDQLHDAARRFTF